MVYGGNGAPQIRDFYKYVSNIICDQTIYFWCNLILENPNFLGLSACWQILNWTFEYLKCNIIEVK